MRHIAVLSDDKVPRNSEFKFKDRADALVKKWQQILNANKANGSSAPTTAGAINTGGEAISAGPMSAAPGSGLVREDTLIDETMKDVGEGEGEGGEGGVTKGTAAIDLNGKNQSVDESGTFYISFTSRTKCIDNVHRNSINSR